MSVNPIVEIRNTRVKKASSLFAQGSAPYPSNAHRDILVKDVLDKFDRLEGHSVTVAGRLMSLRQQGVIAFADLKDHSGKIQLFLESEHVMSSQQPGESNRSLGYDQLSLLDEGDIIEATGKVFKTRRGQQSVHVDTLKMLAKAIRPLPDQRRGLKDREQILRKRYLQTILGSVPLDRFAAISRMITNARGFLERQGFLEIPTPILQPQYGGGSLKPFKTHVNALGRDFYLGNSHELYLKRLIVGGYEKVYTLGKYFRNEGIDNRHHPEFSMLETMAAYQNYEAGMEFVEELYKHVANSAFGKNEFNVRGHRINLDGRWRRVSMANAIFEHTGIDFAACNTVEKASDSLRQIGIQTPIESVGGAMELVFGERVVRKLVQPTFVFGRPMENVPLAKPMSSDPQYAEFFDLYIAGMHCADGYSEQNDPVFLLNAWRKTLSQKGQNSQDTLNLDFMEALEYGMPPTVGIGAGIERMAMIFTEQDNIDDVIFFPMMRPVVSPVNSAIYDGPEMPS